MMHARELKGGEAQSEATYIVCVECKGVRVGGGQKETWCPGCCTSPQLGKLQEEAAQQGRTNPNSGLTMPFCIRKVRADPTEEWLSPPSG